MNKVAEQLSNDIAIRAAQKLAALNGGMEKDAGALLNGLGGAALGGLGGAAIGSLINLIPNDQDLPMYYHGHIGENDIYKPYPAFEGQEPSPKLNPILALTLAGALSGGAMGSGLLDKMASCDTMEKDAGIGDFAKRLWQDPSYRSRLRTRLGQDLGGAVTGAGAGALAGGIANTARGLMFDKPDENQGFFGGIGKSISDFGTGAILGGTLGGIGGAYKTHNNFNAMVNKANDAKGALRENFSSTYGPYI